MRNKTDILVIGAGPAGVVCALTAKKYYPDKKIVVMRNVEKGVIPCGIPYMIKSLKSPDENVLGMVTLEKNGIETVVDEAIAIDRNNKTVECKSDKIYKYEKLVLAVGSTPILPPIPGIEKEGIYPIYKELGYLKKAIEEIKKCKNILIVGGGFIGIEFADELSKINGLNTYLVELLPNVLANSFDLEFSTLAENKLKSKGVKILTGVKVLEFCGKGRVEKVRLSTAEEIETGAVILGIGACPDTTLARKTGLDLGKGKGIWVDEYMRTVDPDVFAVGDCAGKRDFYTRKDMPVMLASTATAEARIAGANLYQLKVIRENKGTIAVYSTYIDGLVLGSAGLTQTSAIKEGFEIVTGQASVKDKHPVTMPLVSDIKVKLVFSRQSGILLGGQVAGGFSCGEMINLIGVAIQKRMSATELETLQIATQPYLTSAPTMYPIVVAAQDAIGKMHG
ncbi:MAG: FAD-dependent oxidoreductase [Candidatus Omnitrophica bacterium]|nr:FAD-dependent oxidoreductase [Candidatus Omnitrophota bacterium]